MSSKPRVLFFSTGDSTRSRMAEGFMRLFAGDRIITSNTAVQSTSFDPLAEEVMNETGIDIKAVHTKHVGDALKDPFSYVVSVCDASRERFPVWPFCRNIIHWDLIDPEKVPVSEQQKRTVFRNVRDDISQRVKSLAGEILSASSR